MFDFKKYFYNLGIKNQMFFSIIFTTGIILLVVVWFSFTYVSDILEEEFAVQSNYMETLAISSINEKLDDISGDVVDLSVRLQVTGIQNINYDKKDIELLFRGRQEIEGVTVYLTKSNKQGDLENLYLYACRTAAGIKFYDLNKEKAPEGQVVSKVAGWSIVSLLDDSEDSKFSKAAYTIILDNIKQDGERLSGYISVNTYVNWMSDLIKQSLTEQVEHAFVISDDGRILHIVPDGKKEKYTCNFREVFNKARKDDPNFYKAIEAMQAGDDSIALVKEPVTQKNAWLTYSPFSKHWSMGVFFLRETLLKSVYKFSLHLITIGVVGFVFLCIIMHFVAGSMVKPIKKLDLASREVASGNLDMKVPIPIGDDEVVHLSRSFNIMLEKLKEHIEITKDNAVKSERVQSQLRIAAEIQMSRLPQNFEKITEDSVIDFFAFLRPALEVGGDFYNFEKVGKEELFFVIGDVAGKGVPAAIFMTVAQTFLSIGFYDKKEQVTPSKVLNSLNAMLSQGNDTCMFATVFCAKLNLRTGKLTYANGGHVPPVLIKNSKETEFLNVAKNPPVGFSLDSFYQDEVIILNKNDALFLCTDGVTEAENKKEEFFGLKRLLEELSVCSNLDCKKTTAIIDEKIEAFAEGHEQSDDIAMLMVRFNGYK